MNIKNEDVLKNLKKLPRNFINTVFCDPPYNMSSKWYIDKNTGSYKVLGSWNNKGKDIGTWSALGHRELNSLFHQLRRVCKYGAYVIMYGVDRQEAPFKYYANKWDFESCQSLYWAKPAGRVRPCDAKTFIDKRLGNDGQGEILEQVVYKNPPNKIYRDCPDGSSKRNREYTIRGPVSRQAKMFNGYKFSSAPFKNEIETVMVFRNTTKNETIVDDLIMSVDSDDISPAIVDSKVPMSKSYKSQILYHKKARDKIHPTPKPVDLNTDIVSRFKLPDEVNQKWYVPFSGIGSEILGIINCGVPIENIYGCELNKEYYERSKERINNFMYNNEEKGE